MPDGIGCAAAGGAAGDVVTGDALGLRAGLGRPSIGFVAVCLGYFAIILDGSVLNVAVPAIRTDLHGSLGGAQWVLNAYTRGCQFFRVS